MQKFPFLKPRPETPTPTPPPSNPFLSLQNHFTSILANVSTSVQSIASRLAPPPPPPPQGRSPAWARVSPPAAHRFDMAMTAADIEERLAGVPVYALSNAEGEFVLVSGPGRGRALGLFCFREEDAGALLDQMKSMDQGMRQGSKVVAVALQKVVQLKLDGVAFRFIPDSSQVSNAIKEMKKAGDSADGFSGVPVFQSKSLVLRSQNKRYRPVFFRKEDLDSSLRRAAHQQRKLNPSLRQGDVEVGILEEIIEAMKESSPSEWDDVVFIPPGLDVPTGIRESAVASA